jgi:hypothetical protein
MCGVLLFRLSSSGASVWVSSGIFSDEDSADDLVCQLAVGDAGRAF